MVGPVGDPPACCGDDLATGTSVAPRSAAAPLLSYSPDAQRHAAWFIESTKARDATHQYIVYKITHAP